MTKRMRLHLVIGGVIVDQALGGDVLKTYIVTVVAAILSTLFTPASVRSNKLGGCLLH